MKIETEHGYYTIDVNNKYHSYNDEPAIVIETYIDEDENEIEGYKAWMSHGEIHRENGPAIIRNSGEEFFYKNGIKIWQ